MLEIACPHPRPLSTSVGGVRNDSETTARYIAAEIDFFADLQNRIEQGEIVPPDEAERDYALKMKEHEIK